MTHTTVVTDKAGIGKFSLSKFMKNPDDLSGHSFYIGNEILEIGKDNIVTFPLKLMQKIGYKRSDGRYAVAFDIDYRHVNKVKVAGGYVIKTDQIGKYLELAKDGQRLPKAAIVENYEDLEILEPADIPEWTQSGDYA